MRNHNEKVRDMTRSVLPSAARGAARNTREHIHRAERRAVAAALRNSDEAPRRDYRSELDQMVWDRRSADKVAPLVRWALHHVRTNPELCNSPLHEQIDHFRQLLPDTTIGRHALSHIAWPLERQHPDPPPARWYGYYLPRTPPAPLEPVVRRLYEAGYHRELNKRLKAIEEPTLAGVADIEGFAQLASAESRSVIVRLAAATHLARP